MHVRKRSTAVLNLDLLLKAPPKSGPTTLAIPQTAPITPVNAGLFAKGTDFAIMISAPENIPDPPIPAIALPTIRTTELGAAPDMADPTSKIKTAGTKLHLIDSRV